MIMGAGLVVYTNMFKNGSIFCPIDTCRLFENIFRDWFLISYCH